MNVVLYSQSERSQSPPGFPENRGWPDVLDAVPTPTLDSCLLLTVRSRFMSADVYALGLPPWTSSYMKQMYGGDKCAMNACLPLPRRV